MPTETSVLVSDGITTTTVLVTNGGQVQSETTTVQREVRSITLDADIASRTTKTYVYASMCSALLKRTLTVEEAFCPTYTQGSEKVEDATADGSGFYTLRRRTTTRQRQDEPTLTELSGNYVWTYPDIVGEQVIEDWLNVGPNAWHYTRVTMRLLDRLTRFDEELDRIPAGLYRRSVTERFSETTDKPPPTADCVMLAEDDAAADEDEADTSEDPCEDLFGPCGNTPAARSAEQRILGIRTLDDGRGRSILGIENPTQVLTSPLLTAHTFAEIATVKALAAVAKAHVDTLLTGPSSSLTESQPFLEPVAWADDIVRIALDADVGQSLTVERRIYGGAPIVD
jgi:hypothetical protein